MELRCKNGILFGLLLPSGQLEFKCRSRRCGHEPGVLVFHRFDPLTGQEVQDSPKRYRDSAYHKEDR